MWFSKHDPYSRLMAVLAAVIVGVLFVAGTMLYVMRTTLIQRAGETLALAADNTAHRLDRMIFERAGDIQLMSRAFSGRLENRRYLSAYMNWMQEAYPVYRWLGVTDLSGNVLSANSTAWVGQDRSNAEWFKKARQEGRAVILNADAYAETNGRMSVGFATPIQDTEGQIQGVVAAFVELALLEGNYLGTHEALRALGALEAAVEYIVVDHDGRVLIDSLLHEEDYSPLLGMPSLQLLRSSDRAGYVEETSNRRGMPLITGYARTHGYRSVADPRWGVLVRVSRADVLGPISRVTGLVGVSALVVVTPLLVLLGWMVTRLKRETATVIAHEEELRGAQSLLEHRVAERTQELVEKQQQLIQSAKLASLGQLSAGIAHELNNPLNNIGLFVGNALDQVDEGMKGRHLLDPLHDQLHAALEQIRRATKIIHQLRTFARASGTQMGPVNVRDTIQAAVALVAEQFRLQQVEVVLDIASPEARVKGNLIQLEQVLVNLLTNAADAMSSAPVKRLHIGSEEHEDWHVLKIEDTGEGIAKSNVSRVFDPFFTTKDVGVGTGLGLSIVYGIIKDHGGYITVDSEPGLGTCFQIRLPAYREACCT